MGNYAEAISLNDDALNIAMHILGKKNPDVETIINNFLTAYFCKGDFDKARSLYEKSFAIRTEIFWSEHPDIATSLANLAVVHRNRATT